MCFGGETVSAPSNPAPYSTADAYTQVGKTQQSAGPNGTNALSPAAAQADQQDEKAITNSNPAASGSGLGMM